MIPMTKWLIALWLIIIPAAAIAQGFGAASESEEKERYFQALLNAPSETAGRKIESSIWEYWLSQSPTAEVRALMDKGMERRKAYDYEAAEKHFDEVVALAPDYSEGYNQRAFVRFLRENFDQSLTDLEKTLELEPKHFGALSGMYHLLRLKNRVPAAMRSLQLAVAIHPWIQERHALPKEMWPKRVPVQDL